MRIEDLSVNERILVHLKDFTTDPESEGAPIGQTQEGIADAVGIKINHVPRATNSLMGDTYIDESLVHVGGLKRKRKAFFLTPRGSELAVKIIDQLKKQKILFRDSSGLEHTEHLHEILFKARGITISHLILAYFREGVILESSLSGAPSPSYITILPERPQTDTFVDRTEEAGFIRARIRSGSPLTVVSGIKGIGKTALVLRALKEFEGSKNILWYSLHEWDSARNLLEQMAENHVRLGRNGLKKYLRQYKDTDLGLAFASLFKDLQDSESVLVFDSIFDLKRETLQLLYMLCEHSHKLNNISIVLITRDRQSLSPTPCLGTLGPNDLVLKGLDRASAMELLGSMGVPPDVAGRVFAMTQGHPLALKLVNSDEIMKLVDTKGLTDEELWVVRCMKAFDAIFE
jgi:hypothetical protein